MSDIADRLTASLRCGALNGDSFERGVVANQIHEAVDEIKHLQKELALLGELREVDPLLLAEAKQPAELIERLRHDLNNSTCNEEVAIIRHVKTRAVEERDAWKAKAIEERTYRIEDSIKLDDVENETWDERMGRARKLAASELEDEMRYQVHSMLRPLAMRTGSD